MTTYTPEWWQTVGKQRRKERVQQRLERKETVRGFSKQAQKERLVKYEPPKAQFIPVSTSTLDYEDIKDSIALFLKETLWQPFEDYARGFSQEAEPMLPGDSKYFNYDPEEFKRWE